MSFKSEIFNFGTGYFIKNVNQFSYLAAIIFSHRQATSQGRELYRYLHHKLSFYILVSRLSDN